MNIQIDINGSVKRAIEATTKFGEFWKGKTFPDDLGPSISHMLVIGLLPAAGSLLGSLLFWLAMIIKGAGAMVGFKYFFGYILMIPIFTYLLAAVMPAVIGVVLGMLAPSLSIDKGDANSFATVISYSASPAFIASFITSVLMGFFGFIFVLIGFGALNWLIMLLSAVIGLAGAVISLILNYNGYNSGLAIESGQSIILLVLQIIIYLIAWGIVMGILVAIFGGNMLGPWNSIMSSSWAF